MKKKLVVSVLVLTFIVSILCFSGCNPTPDTTVSNGEVNIIMPDGAPALSMAKLMNDKPVIDGFKTKYEIVAGTNVVAKVLNGEADVAIVPTNAAAIIYNKGIDVQLVSANLFGLLYMVGKEDVTNLADLKGEVVGVIGRGNSPDLTLKYILNNANIEYEESDTAVADKVAFRYVTAGSELIPLLKKGDLKFGLLGEPAVSMACDKADCQVVFDIQELLNTATNTTNGFPQASLVVKKSIIESNPEFITQLLAKLTESAGWIEDNADSIGQILTDNGSVLGTDYTADIIKNCNIRVEKASEVKLDIDTYLTILFNFDAKTVGGKLPDDDFYYAG